MIQSLEKKLSIAEFLQLPETKPAREYINGHSYQKPMPQGKHSQIQGQLVTAINEVAAKQRTALALPELRCTFGDRSIVPDIAIFSWDHIPLDPEGDIADQFNTTPDWVIEILSPDQNQSRVTANILYCLQSSCQMGWLIDPKIKSILIYPKSQQPEFFQEPDQLLPIPDFVPTLQLTVGDIFSWLKPGNT